MRKNDVAIIMRSKDEYPYVEHALESLKKQTFQDFDLYNIDSGSTDGTLESVKAHNGDRSKIFEIRPEEYMPGPVLNRMVAETSAPYIVFLNADAIPVDKFWLERLLKPILEGELDATMSRQIPRESAYFIVKYDYHRSYQRKNIEGKNPFFFSAVACAFKREMWEKFPFYIDGYSEDVEWSKRCQEGGYRFRLIEESVVEHSHNYTLKQLFKRKLIEAEADVLIYGETFSFPKQLLACCREVVRDFLYSVRMLKWGTIPYNLVYRIVAHCGFYQGKKLGTRKKQAMVR